MKKLYKEFCSVNDIIFNVKNGETFTILGENGAGKSTTMRMIACRSPLTSGNLSHYMDEAEKLAKRLFFWRTEKLSLKVFPVK
ncbi:MAG: ATP-binding cassette domain-containing protein [Nitrosopumilus sp.]|nr:ATP-binding cassette domain-containing protein [Nitrosopumilus sp.]